MADYLKRSWARVDLDALAENTARVRGALRPGCGLMGVVKADAYGHGARRVAAKLAECGVEWFGVSNIDEALELRRWQLRQPILIFGNTPTACAARLAEHNITQTVYSPEYALALQEAARAAGVRVRGHIKLDTGMTRLGFLCGEGELEPSAREIAHAVAHPNLQLDGIFTHFAVADETENGSPAYTRMQFDRFLRMTKCLEALGVSFALRHCANSAAVLCYPDMQLDLVRPGIILYGLSPSPECAGKLPLRPVLSLESVLVSVKRVGAGTQVSYGRAYTAPGPRLVGVVPIGYADGYRRGLSNRARMLVRGQNAPVIGRVCMDQLMLDLSEIEGAQPGDPVTIIGEQGGAHIGAEDLARLLDTIPYEITCQLSKRVPRVYWEHGQEADVEHFA